ncbi:MAG: hypothetical protein R1F54_05245 [Candidatus Zeuxoniibacter abyssi]|nr:MAG: hypothetical protein R1F54_05245 [Candidatus Persebacteraceae bacterium AB1(2)]
MAGAGTGHDQIHEYYRNSGDAGDEIRIKSGIGVSDIHLVRSNNGNHLHVQLLGEADDDGVRAVTDRLTVERYYTDASAKVEKITAGDKVLLSSQYTALIDEMSLFENGTSGFSSVEDIYNHYWQDAGSITTPGIKSNWTAV